MTSILQSLLPLCIALFTLAASLVRHYASPRVSIPVKLLATIAFALGFGGVALLPIDLRFMAYVSSGSSDITDEYDGVYESLDDVQMSNADSNIFSESPDEKNETYVPWQVTYWSTFLLAWLVLPITRESLLSGEFTAAARVKNGARKSARGILILLVLAVVAIIALGIYLRSLHVIPVLMALGNTYGLLLVSLLLGYGLVDLPKQLWKKTFPEDELRRARIMAVGADEALFDAVWELQDYEDLIDGAVEAIDRCGELSSNLINEETYKQYVDDLVLLRNSTAELSPDLQSRRTNNRRRHSEAEDDDPVSTFDGARPTVDYLVHLHARLKLAQEKVIGAQQRWEVIVEQSRFYSNLVEGSTPQSSPGQNGGEDQQSSLPLMNEQLVPLGTKVQGMWRKHLRNPTYRLMALSTAGLSILILWCEATLAVEYNLSPFNLFLDLLDGPNGRQKGTLFQIAALIPLLYMSTCVYSSLFKLGTFGPYCLRGNRQSHGVALLFNAQYLVRLQFPLGYNYLLMTKYDISFTNCAFSQLMSHMDTVPVLGTSFSVYAPLLILALCGFTLCDGYPRLMAVLGVEHEDAILLSDKETLNGKVNEGISLLRKYERRAGSSRQSTKTNNDRTPSPRRLPSPRMLERSDSSHDIV
mmetsp:Transcript_5562/g.8221  ORF Transcript_5562/g.8221 Transcript_5562/m.8221 type:complete len:642 (-) Transcript_5562:117-2042(-)